ncbi:MAG: hypothetical protein J5U17_06940 [Candidatus Methanoperedens sp.]|nr:hypothetical protein [Candidatus Methanoperedens sp.]MCE8428647.1 hypothetical protein [Candidatus Methanoperedens sp.]
MSYEINVDHEAEISNYYRTLGISCGEGDILFRLIMLVLLEKGENEVTQFSDIRKYTDPVADKGSVGSKIKAVILFQGLALKVERGGYVITEKGMVAAEYIKTSTKFYEKWNRFNHIIERFPA